MSESPQHRHAEASTAPPNMRGRSNPVLLLHGGHLGAWVWDDVIRELETLGVEASAIDLPSRLPGATLADDVRETRTALQSFDAPVVLVGHSYSGAVISAAAAANGLIAHLVFAAAALPLEGQSVASSLRDEPQEQLPPRTDDDDWVLMDSSSAKLRVLNDADDEQLEAVLPRMGRYSSRISTEVPQATGWNEHASTYLVCTLDRSFPLDAQRRFARRTTRSVDIEAGHAPMVTKPVEVARAIAEIARER